MSSPHPATSTSSPEHKILHQMTAHVSRLLAILLLSFGIGKALASNEDLPELQSLCRSGRRYLPFNLEGAKIRYNNLGGVDTTKCAVLWYEDVVTVKGEALDLVVRALPTNPYRAPQAEPRNFENTNGRFYQLGQLSIGCNATGRFEFKLIRARCRATVVAQDPRAECCLMDQPTCSLPSSMLRRLNLLWVYLNIGQRRNSRIQARVTLSNATKVHLTQGSKIEEITSSSGITLVGHEDATVAQKPKSNDLNALSTLQKQQLAIAESREGIAGMHVEVSAHGQELGKLCGWSLLFSGGICAEEVSRKRPWPEVEVEACTLPTPEPTRSPTINAGLTSSPTQQRLCTFDDIQFLNLRKAPLLYNNLGGFGPNFDNEQGGLRQRHLSQRLEVIWFQDVARTFSGRSMDLILREAKERGSNYRPGETDPNSFSGFRDNGRYFDLGMVNLACNSYVTIEHIFVDHECAIRLGDAYDPSIDTACDLVVPELEWTFYDMDVSPNGNVESTLLCNVFGTVPIFGSAVVQQESSELCPDGMNLTAVVVDGRNDLGDSPHTANLEENSIEAIRKLGRVLMNNDISRFIARYSVSGPDSIDNCARRILFHGTLCMLPFT